ncbi:MAG TPA: hypothetical protein V6C72_08585, partial [Chroococcales cyanobacterium]
MEYKSERLAQDLTYGNEHDAANLLRNELMCNPREAMMVINQARHMKPYNSVEDVVREPNGLLGIMDRRNGHVDIVGRDPMSYQGYQNYPGYQGYQGNQGFHGPVTRNHFYPDQNYNQPYSQIYNDGCFGNGSQRFPIQYSGVNEGQYYQQPCPPDYYRPVIPPVATPPFVPSGNYEYPQVYSNTGVYPRNESVYSGPAGVTYSDNPVFPPSPGVASSMGDLNAV